MTSRFAVAVAALILAGFAGRALAKAPEGFVEYAVYIKPGVDPSSGWRVMIGKDRAMVGYLTGDKYTYGLILPKGEQNVAGVVDAHDSTWSDGTVYHGKSDWSDVRGGFDGASLRVEGVRRDEGSYYSKPAKAQAASTARLLIKLHLTFSADGACKVVQGETEDLESTTRFSDGRVNKEDLLKVPYTICVKLSK